MTEIKELRTLLDKLKTDGLTIQEMRRIDQLFWKVVPFLLQEREVDTLDEGPCCANPGVSRGEA